MSQPFLYEGLGYAVLATPKLDESIEFYRDLVGLELVDYEAGDHACFRCSEYFTNFVLCQNDHAGLMRAGFNVKTRQELDKARQHFVDRGYTPEALSDKNRQLFGLAESFSVREPLTGLTFDFYEAMEIPATPFKPTLTQIQRLGHIVIRVKDLDKAWAVMRDDFNMLASDYVADKAVWMRAYPNPLHHSFAMVKEDTSGLHHINFMVSEIDDVGQALNRLVNAGVPIVFGPGRHKPSGSIFLYFTDPAGMTMEFSFGMEEFPREGAREPRKLAFSAKVMDLWGGKPKPTFANHGAIVEPVAS